MKCYYHPDLDSANACSVCSRLLCASCSHRVKGRFFCQDCLVQGAELAALARTPTLANYSPSRAAFFGIIPGIGAVYNRQYEKAVTHFAIFAGLIILADSAGIFGFAAFAFYLFTIIDAYRSAQGILRQVIEDPGSLRNQEEAVKLPVWGAILVLLGVLFFLDNLGALSLRAATHFAWPLLFVAMGLYMIFSYLATPAKSPKPPMPPLQDPPGYPPPFHSQDRESSSSGIAEEGN